MKLCNLTQLNSSKPFPNYMGSATLICFLRSLLSSAKLTLKLQLVISFLIISIHVSLGLPLPLALPWIVKRSLFLTGASKGFHCMCPNNRNRFSLILSSIGATPTISRICSFRILSFKVLPHIHLN